MLAVTNLPSDGHKVLSSNNSFLPTSLTSLASQGSDTHSPSTCFFKNNVGIIVLSVVHLLRCLSSYIRYLANTIEGLCMSVSELRWSLRRLDSGITSHYKDGSATCHTGNYSSILSLRCPYPFTAEPGPTYVRLFWKFPLPNPMTVWAWFMLGNTLFSIPLLHLSLYKSYSRCIRNSWRKYYCNNGYC